MKLVVDASTMVAEGLRARGREILSHPACELLVTAEILSETTHELGKRITYLIQHGFLEEDQAIALFGQIALILASRVTVVFSAEYAHRVAEARWRVPRDPNDVPSMALALALDCGIWTNDHDFFGCGLPIWATDVLRHYLYEAQGE